MRQSSRIQANQSGPHSHLELEGPVPRRRSLHEIQAQATGQQRPARAISKLHTWPPGGSRSLAVGTRPARTELVGKSLEVLPGRRIPSAFRTRGAASGAACSYGRIVARLITPSRGTPCLVTVEILKKAASGPTLMEPLASRMQLVPFYDGPLRQSNGGTASGTDAEVGHGSFTAPSPHDTKDAAPSGGTGGNAVDAESRF